MLVCTLGDLVLDVVVRPSRPLVVGGDVPAETVVAPGGQAANVAAWVAALGGRARYLGKRADDDAGALVVAFLHERGVEVVGPVVAGVTGIVVSLVNADGERTMVSSRGVAADLRADELEPGWLDCYHLHVSGYALAAEPARDAARAAVAAARGHGARVSIDLSAATLIESAGQGPFPELLERLAPDAVFCNEDEDRAVGGRLDGATWILKRGPGGVSVDGTEHSAAQARDVVDATGAGDAFAAGWILGGVELGLRAAAACVSRVGAFPAR